MEIVKIVKCPEGHELTPFTPDYDGHFCDGCQYRQSAGTTLNSCKDCGFGGYDICKRCYEIGTYVYFNSTGMTIKYKNAFSEPNALWNDHPNFRDVSIDEIPENTKYVVCHKSIVDLLKKQLQEDKNRQMTILSFDETNSRWRGEKDYHEVDDFTIEYETNPTS